MKRIITNFNKDGYAILTSKTGQGRTRMMINDACFYGIGKYYDWDRCEWIEVNIPSTVCFFSEDYDSHSELNVLLLSWVSGISETEIIEDNLTDEQKIVLKSSIKLLDMSNIYVVPNINNRNAISRLKPEYLFIDGISLIEEMDIKNEKYITPYIGDATIITSAQVRTDFIPNIDNDGISTYISGRNGRRVSTIVNGEEDSFLFDFETCRKI